MARSKRLTLRITLAATAVILAIVSIAWGGFHERIDTTVLLLLAAAALILLIPWEKMSSLKAVGVEITLNLPQVKEAVESLDRIARATGGDAIDNGRVRRSLERLSPELELIPGSRILWIDDNPSAIVGVRRLLRALGATIVTVTSTQEAVRTLASDNDFDLLITDLMRNDPAACVSFDWTFDYAEALAAGGDLPVRSLVRRSPTAVEVERITRDSGYVVEFEVRRTSDGTSVYQRREGVNFVCRLRLAEDADPIVREIPVLFFASFPWSAAFEYAKPALLPEFATEVTNSAETLIASALRMVAAARSRPIAVGAEKIYVKA